MDFEERLKELKQMVDSDGDTDLVLFNVRYAELLREITRSGGSRYPLLFRLRQIGCHQQAHLMNLWLKEKGMDVVNVHHFNEGMN